MKYNKETIVLFSSWGFPLILLLTEEGIYFEENVLQDLEFRCFPEHVDDFDFYKMEEMATKCCAAYVHVKPGIKKWLLEDDEKTWLYFYHSSVIKMMDILCNGYIGVFDEIKQLEKIWREKGVDELVASAEMAEAKTPKEMQELLDFYITKIAPIGECII